MTRILLADDSPHAQRMGERILREEGFEVVTVTDGNTALVRLSDVDPDLVLADVSLPGHSGYEICREIRSRPRHRHVRVVLTAGLLEHVDEMQAVAVRCDAVLKKPFEASAMLDVIRPLIESAGRERAEVGAVPEEVVTASPSAVSARSLTTAAQPADYADAEVERVRAAVTLALDAALPSMIDHITEQVLTALKR